MVVSAAEALPLGGEFASLEFAILECYNGLRNGLESREG